MIETVCSRLRNRLRQTALPHQSTGPWLQRFHLGPGILAHVGLCCPNRHRLPTPSASLAASVPLPGDTGYKDGLSPVTRPSGLSLLYSSGLPPSVSAGRFDMCLPQFFHTDTGHHEKVGTTWPLQQSRKSASRGVPDFGDLFVRSRYGPPDCSLSGLIRTEKSCPPRTFTSGLPATGSPQ